MWRDGDDEYVSVGGTGSISCLGLTTEEGLEAERRRGPLGFHTALEEATRAAVAARAEETERLVVAALTAAGEAAWTARDTFAVVEYPDGHVEVA